MDDYETHDDRRLLPGTGFTIEPGVYFDDFGVRSEINMIVRERDAVVTGPLQSARFWHWFDGGFDVHPQDHALLLRLLICRRRRSAVGMVIASRLDLTPASSAQTLAVPPMNSAPVTGPLDAQTRSATSPRRSRRWSSTSGPR